MNNTCGCAGKGFEFCSCPQPAARTAPSKPKPKPLTPLTEAQIEQIKARPECWEHIGQRIAFCYLPFARAIERAHGIGTTSTGEIK